ncbi:hypothetical protein L1I79_04225 [Strepomyces sp. STD 3.1]|uniref:hypothetical protein n=1 Tax=Streptomyces sp. NPDC058985 TaxID=3346684 RepID=UPI001F480329|nr:hypothetical protein [Streptomyces sp. STD 3.1]
MVSPSRLGDPRRLFFVACAVLALGAVALAWYATRTVRPDCVVGVSTVTGRDGPGLPGANGRIRPDPELIDRAYRQAIASGHCDPPGARWKRWLD